MYELLCMRICFINCHNSEMVNVVSLNGASNAVLNSYSANQFDFQYVDSVGDQWSLIIYKEQPIIQLNIKKYGQNSWKNVWATDPNPVTCGNDDHSIKFVWKLTGSNQTESGLYVIIDNNTFGPIITTS